MKGNRRHKQPHRLFVIQCGGKVMTCLGCGADYALPLSVEQYETAKEAHKACAAANEVS